MTENGDEIKKYVISKTNQTTVPNVFIAGNHVGGYDDTAKAQKQGTLTRMLNSGMLNHLLSRRFGSKKRSTLSSTNNHNGSGKHKPTSSSAAASNGSASPRPKPTETIQEYVDKLLDANKIVIFSKTTCPYCVKTKELFGSLNETFVAVELDEIRNQTR